MNFLETMDYINELSELCKESLNKKESKRTDIINDAGYNVSILSEDGIEYNSFNQNDDFTIFFVVNKGIVIESRYMNLIYK